MTEDTQFPPVKYASFNSRVIATSLDMGLVLFLVQPVMDFIMERLFNPVDVQHIVNAIEDPNRTVWTLWTVIMQEHVIGRTLFSNLLETFFIGLYVVPFWFHYSSTLGKMVTRIEIRDATTGEKMTRRQSVIRYFKLYRFRSSFSLGFIWVLTNKKRRGWHDYIANTVVVVKPRVKKVIAARLFPKCSNSTHPSANQSGCPAPA